MNIGLKPVKYQPIKNITFEKGQPYCWQFRGCDICACCGGIRGESFSFCIYLWCNDQFFSDYDKCSEEYIVQDQSFFSIFCTIFFFCMKSWYIFTSGFYFCYMSFIVRLLSIILYILLCFQLHEIIVMSEIKKQGFLDIEIHSD